MEPAQRNSGSTQIRVKAAEVRPPFSVKQAVEICPNILRDHTLDVPASLLFEIPERHTVDTKFPLFAIVFSTPRLQKC